MTVPFDIADGNKQKIISTFAFTCERIHFDEQTVKMFYFDFVSTHTFHDNDILLQDNSLRYFFIRPAQGFEIVCKMWKDVLQVILIALSASLVGVDMSWFLLKLSNPIIVWPANNHQNKSSGKNSNG